MQERTEILRAGQEILVNIMGALSAMGITLGNVIEIAVFVVGAIFVVATMRYDLGRLKEDFKKLGDGFVSLEAKYDKLEEATAEQILETERSLGETVSAIREKIVLIELYMRDNFVRKETFNPVLGDIKNEIRGIGDKLEARLLRLEAKINTPKGHG